MPVFTSVYLLPPSLSVADVQTALNARWQLTWGPAQPVRRDYFDTQDARLASAGGVLQAKRSATVLGLIYEDLRNGKPMASCRAQQLPAMAKDLPPGILRDTLTPILGDRRLVNELVVESALSGWRIARVDQSAVRLVVETGRCRARETADWRELAPRITVVPATGPSEAAQHVALYLEERLGLQAQTLTRLAQARQEIAPA